MKTKVATLDVYFDPQSTEPSGTADLGHGQYALVVNGNKGEMAITSREQLQTIMAHELGHFIGMVTQDPTHNPRLKFSQMFTGDTSFVLPGERKAWELAHKMDVPVDAKLEHKCISSYEHHANRNQWGSSAPTPSPTFCVIYQTKYGSTIESADPKTDSLKYMAMLAAQGRGYQSVEHSDGTITVLGDGIMSLTFEQPTDREMQTWNSHLAGYPAESDVLPAWLQRLYLVMMPVLALFGYGLSRWGSHARPSRDYYRIPKSHVHKAVKITLHACLFMLTIAACVAISEALHHWQAVTVASVSAASYAVKGIEVLTDVIADRLFPTVG